MTGVEHSEIQDVRESGNSSGAVVVGLDGSPQSHQALSWAAANTSGPVQLVVAWTTPWWGVSAPLGGSAVPPPDSYFEAFARQTIEDALPLLGDRETLPPLIRRGHAGQCLVDLADHQALLVIGSRGRGAIASAVLGSISAYCASKSRTPVVIVPDTGVPAQPMQRIAVGVDGSANSDAALAWAFDNSPTDAVVVAISAWSPPMSYDGAILVEIDDLEQRYTDMLDAAMERIRQARPSASSRTIETEVVLGDARSVLRDADADVLVVGSRGHHGLEYLLMGSTASALAHQPKIPTVIVPSGAADD
jgi:nucleotide-binding universal stress UspA family protein